MKPWAKLWRYESREFKKLSARARMLAAYLIKVVDDEGRLPMGHRDPVSAVAIAICADTGDRRWLRDDVAALLKHEFLTVDEDARELVVVNYPRYQEEGARAPSPRREPSASRASTGREPDANQTRVEPEPNANQTRDEREPDARIDVSAHNDSLARSVLSSQREEDREERGERGERERASALATAPHERMLRSLTRPTKLEAEVVALVSETRQSAGGAPYRPQGHRDRDTVQRLAEWASDPSIGIPKLREALEAFWSVKGTGSPLSWLADEEPGRLLGSRRKGRENVAQPASHEEHAAVVAAHGRKGEGYAIVQL